MVNLFENPSPLLPLIIARSDERELVFDDLPTPKVQKKASGRTRYLSEANQQLMRANPGRKVQLSENLVDDSYISTRKKQAVKLSPYILVEHVLMEESNGTYKCHVFGSFNPPQEKSQPLAA